MSARDPRSRVPLRRTILLAAILGGVALTPLAAGSVAAAGTTYHVDCSAGNDSASGTSPSSAWRSLTKANSAPLRPGDLLLLKRGCTWTGPLDAHWSGTSTSPITISAYGSGELPKIQNGHENVKVTGAWMVIEDIWTRSDVPSRDSGCNNQPQGWRVGFRFLSGANNTTVRYSRADEQYIGMLVEGGSHHIKLISNTLRNNNMKDPDPNSDAGAVGISLMGDDNTVAYNTISGSDACSRQHGRDGSAVEVYGGKRNSIHHNTASQNINFTELGKPGSADNTYAYNRVTSSLTTANFLVTRGASSGYGPVYRTKIVGNSVYLSGSQSYAVQCTAGCGTGILTMRNNIIWAQDRIGYADNAFDEGTNIYWRADGAPKVYFPMASSSRKVDPKFIDRTASDLHLQSASPAIDKGSTVALSLGFNADLDGHLVPQGLAPDIGAYERTSSTVAATSVTYASDGFTRNLAAGWGSAAIGGSYRYAGTTADFSVNGAQGLVRTSAGSTRGASLGSVLSRDTDAVVRFRTDRLASGSGTFVYLVARQSADRRAEYRLKVRLDSARAIHLQVTRVLGGIETDIGAEVVTGLVHSAGTFYWMHMSTTGAGPTTIRGRLWLDGASEPTSWKIQQTDASAVLQVAGAPGVQSYVSSSASAASLISYDDWRVIKP